MRDELIRAVIAVPVATLLPLGLPTTPRWWWRAAIAAALTLAALWTHNDNWQTWVIVVSAAVAASAPVGNRHAPRALVAATAGAILVAVGITDPGAAGDGLKVLADRRDVMVVLAGALACVFIGGALIGSVLRPFAAKVRRDDRDIPGMENAGRFIGWLERALLYGLVLAGAPDAAALVIAGKSIARFPSFEEEHFAEYYLIGSLLSLALAVGTALAVRAIIGVHPVVPS